MKKKIVFAGFRHGHILSLFNRLTDSTELEITAVAEEDPAALKSFLETHPGLTATVYTSIDEMLARADCDIVAIGDYYTKRGSIAIRALQAGKHIIADKPLCTSLEDLEQIRRLSIEKHRAVGCILDLRTMDQFAAAREIILAGKLGKITQIHFGGQHPLSRGSRPSWYFEEGKHGGTITDIAIHAIDYIPWLTGLEYQEILAARTWHAFEPESSPLKDAAQFMLVMNNGCGVMGDVSYAAPNAHGGQAPHYWHFTIWGTAGVMDFCYAENKILIQYGDKPENEVLTASPWTGPNYLTSFLEEVNGGMPEQNSANILKRMEQTIRIQMKANQ